MIDEYGVEHEDIQYLEIELTEELQILFDPEGIPTRYVFLTGGRAGQKSFGSSTWLCYETFDEDVKALYLRQFLISASDSIIPEFEEKVSALGYQDDFKSTTKNVVNLSTNSEVLFRGINTSQGNQTAKLKGIKNVTVVLLDEAEETVDPEDFDKIDHGIRANTHRNVVFVIMNPSTVDHWTYQRWIKDTHRIEIIDGVEIPISTHPDVTHIHLTYLDNLDNLSDSYLKVIQNLKKTNFKLYCKIFLGTWDDVKTGNEIYPGFQRERNAGHVPYLEGIPIWISFDQNVRPYITANLWQVRYHGDFDEKIEIRCFKEYTLKDPDNTTRILCKKIVKDQGDRLEGFRYTGDASGGYRKGTVSKLTDYDVVDQVLSEYSGHDAKQVWRANPSVSKRCEFISDIMAGNFDPKVPGMEDVTIIIDSIECPKTILDFVKVKKDVNGAKLKEKETKDGTTYEPYGHTSDAADYIIIKVLKWLYDLYRGKKKSGVHVRK